VHAAAAVPWTYYAFWIVASVALALISAHPGLLAVIVIAVALRRWLPDPVLYLRHAPRVRSLRQQVELNPANAVARAQLAEIWLAKRRPRRAIPLLEQALGRDPSSAELRYLLGLAHLHAGQPKQALDPLSEALARDHKVRYGAGYLAIADALVEVKRNDEAIEAYERFVKINTSSLEGFVKLAHARARTGDTAGAARARKEALDTFRVLPAFQRRRQLGWWVRAQLAI